MPFATRRTFITQSTLAALTAALGASAPAVLGASGRATLGGSAPAAPGASAPAANQTLLQFPGLTPQAVNSFLDAVAEGRFELHSLVIARHGQIAASGWYAPYRPEAPHLLDRKSVV